jgi:(2Fe-2S) ferredoxin
MIKLCNFGSTGKIMKYKKHVFVCVNQRAEGERKCCGEQHGLALVAALKKNLKDKNMNSEVRAQRTGCLDVCELGPSLVVYPEGIFYGNVQLEDVEEIVNSHLLNNKPVERIELKF